MYRTLKNNYMKKVEKFIEETSNGKIFSATFVKKNGTIRTIHCRRGVKKGLTGKGMAYDPGARGLLVVYDLSKKNYRMINLAKLIEAKVNGLIYKFI